MDVIGELAAAHNIAIVEDNAHGLFGKYKGRVIADLPGYYLAWLARKGFPPGQLGQLLALMHELDHNGLGGLLEPLRRARS